jgi:thermitase
MPTAVRAIVATGAALALVAAVQAVRDGRADEPRAVGYVVLEPYAQARVTLPSVRGRTTRPRSTSRRTQRLQSPPPGASFVQPNDPLWQVSWSLAKVRAPEAWRFTTGSPDVVVAILDTGVDLDHPDLQGALAPGWDVVHGDASAGDDHGHGTGVAGIVAARSDNGVGVTGACWRCSLMPIKVIGADGTGSAADIAAGLRWAVDHGASIVNLSFVMSGRDEGVASAIDHALARGVLVVAAAGNTGGAEPTFPASHPGVISVTATDPADGRYAWATHGRWVSIAAPGCSQTTVLGGAYGEFCGSSSAAAFMSGAAALVRSATPAVGGGVVFSTLATNAVPVGEFVSSGRLDVGTTARRSLGVCCAPAPRPARAAPRE